MRTALIGDILRRAIDGCSIATSRHRVGVLQLEDGSRVGWGLRTPELVPGPFPAGLGSVEAPLRGRVFDGVTDDDGELTTIELVGRRQANSTHDT